MAEKLLNSSDVVATLEQVRRKRMSQGVTRGWFCQASRADGIFHYSLQYAFGNVVPLSLARTRINAEA